MSPPRFLQIHTLHSYTAALLNRDDTGQAKRLHYGGSSRTRISSQCLKRHWRTAENDPYALSNVDGYVESFRSRELLQREVVSPLLQRFPADVVAAIEAWLLWAVYSGNNKDKPKKLGEDFGAKAKEKRPTLLFGMPELKWLRCEAAKLAEQAGSDADKAFKLAEEWTGVKQKGSEFLKNIEEMRKGIKLPGGLTAAMFGRMVTSDPAANIDAPIHVAHAFTVHAAETEGDYFTAVDDLKRDEDDSGADTIQETELTCGLFYGYVVIDLPGLIINCGRDRALASRLVHNLTHLIAEVSPGAKLGSTAPYGRADLMLVEAGDRQPRSLATAFRTAVPHDFHAALSAMDERLRAFDEAYSTGEDRRQTCLDGELSGIEQVPLKSLAEWSGQKVQEAPEPKDD
jgi:CRISPR system Cascade subunit CasC